MARALTGFTADWVDGRGFVRFRFGAKRADRGSKTIHGRRGTFGWRDACGCALEHPRARAVRRRAAVGRVHPHADPRRRPRGASRHPLPARRPRGRARPARHPRPSRAAHRRAHGPSRRSCSSRGSCAAPGRASPRRLGLDPRAHRPGALPARRAWRAGTRRAGWTPPAGAAAGVRGRLGPAPAGARPQPQGRAVHPRRGAGAGRRGRAGHARLAGPLGGDARGPAGLRPRRCASSPTSAGSSSRSARCASTRCACSSPPAPTSQTS